MTKMHFLKSSGYKEKVLLQDLSGPEIFDFRS